MADEEAVKRVLEALHPVLRELVGEPKNSGREWQTVGQPELVQVHDLPSQAAGKAIPYGVYGVGANQGWVSVGTDHDTAEFAVATVRRWWQQMGAPKYPDATEPLIIADGGGSNGSRSRLRLGELKDLFRHDSLASWPARQTLS